MIDNDADLVKLLGGSDVANKNIEALRNDLSHQLLQLVETALLSDRKQGPSRNIGNTSKAQLEKRLASLLQPKIPASADQLSFIDDFLSERNSKDVIKKTIDFVKPFFLNVIKEQLEAESRQLLDKLQSTKTRRRALETYLLHESCPDLKLLGLQEKLAKDHEYRHYVRFVDRDDPLAGENWRNKQHQAKVAKNLHRDTSDASIPIEKREQMLMDQAKEQAYLAAQ